MSEQGDEPERPPGKGPGRVRLVVWIVVGALAVYLIVNGVIGVLQKGA